MKWTAKTSLLLFITLTAFIAVSVLLLSPSFNAEAESFNGFSADVDYFEEYDPYSFYFENYSVIYDVSSNRKISVTEDITIHFTGSESTGFMKDIPVNGGEQVRNIEVFEIKNGTKSSVYYSVYSEDSDFITVDIGDYNNKTDKTFIYEITYDYCLTKAQEGKNVLYLNVLGVDRNCIIKNANVKLILPEGYIDAKCFVGGLNSQIENRFTCDTLNGATVLKLENMHLAKYTGISFKINFEDGSLTTYSDDTPYLLLIPAFILLGLVVILKMFVFNKNQLMPVVNYEAPNKMDPLMMGKLIDNKVNDEDVTSLIFYWASKGYIKINLDDRDDPTIIRIMHTLPDSSPQYEKTMYYGLFRWGDVVKPSQLKNRFYKTTQQVTAMVNKHTENLYDKKSLVVCVAFAVLCGLLLGIPPIVIAFNNISSLFIFIPPLFIIVPIILINLALQTLNYYKLKFKRNILLLAYVGIAILCIVAGALYVLIVPTFIMDLGARIALFAAYCPVFTLSVLLVSRTKEYTDKLNDIIGFKNFIMLAEKDQLEMMLEEDPQFYYHILPYAQVLGVTDKWEQKFKDITVQPPQWLTGNAFTTYIEFSILNNIVRSSMRQIRTGMVSHPSSSGSSGSGGFGGGGHVGGGHGGGGFRGR